MKSRHKHFTIFHRALLLSVVALFFIIAVVFATTWGNATAPTWDDQNQQWTGAVEATLDSPSKTVCIEVTDSTATQIKNFSCSDPFGTGVWLCTFSGSEVANWSGPLNYTYFDANDDPVNPCTPHYTDGPSGTFAQNGTGPNAVTLATLSAGHGKSVGLWVIGLIALAGAAMAGVAFGVRRANA